MAFNNYLEDENDKPYFTINSLAYYYDKMEGFAEKVEQAAKVLNVTKEEVEKNITAYIEQNKTEMDQRLAQWDGKLETFDSSVENLLSEWVNDGTLNHVIDSTLIDQKVAPLTLKLTETANVMSISNDFIETGLIDVNADHPDFPLDIPFNVWRNRDGSFGNDFDKDQFKVGATQFYYDWMYGNDTNDGLTPETPKRTITNLLTTVNAHASLKININIMNIHISRSFWGQTAGTFTIAAGKTVIFSPHTKGKFFFAGFERNDLLTWVADGTAYKATRSGAREVFDLSMEGYRGQAKRLKMVASVSEVQSEVDTWYTDGTTVWVHLKGDKTPDENMGVMLNVTTNTFSLAENAKLMFDNAKFYTQSSALGFVDGLRVTGTDSSELYLIDPDIGYSGMNGLSTYGIGKTWVFNPTAHDNYKDGLNYHGNPNNSVFEFMAEGWSNGGDAAGNNNGSTAHDGMSIARFGTVAYKNDGPQIADVGDCYSIMYDCVGYSSTKLTKSNTKAGIFIGGDNPKAYLYNCSGGGQDTYSLSGNTGKIHVRNFKGNDFHANVKENLIVL